jgi:hypothetical protein
MSEFIALAFGLFMPFVVSWLKGSNWPDWTKVALSLAISICGGALAALIDGKLDLQTLAGASGIVFTSATVVYKTWFANTSLNNRLEQQQPLGQPQQVLPEEPSQG